MNNNSKKRSWLKRIRLPRGVIIAICVLPAVLTALFYVLKGFHGIMDWVVMHVSAPVVRFFGMVSAIYPFSMTEIIFTAVGLGLIYYIVKTIGATTRRRGKWKILGKRMLPLLVVAVYVWGSFCWLWNSGYHARGFSEKNGFSGGGVTAQSLADVTSFFADKANEFSSLVDRDEDGRFIENRREMFAASLSIYDNIIEVFPGLSGKLYRPKPMLYSWLMSRTGYGGMFFALTGEANINTWPPGVLMPVTVAHEHAHQLGVFAEDEANFVGLLACITSENVVFEYAGYLRGLMYLSNALASEDLAAWQGIRDCLAEEVVRDWNEEHEFWQSQRRVETGLGFLDSFLTSVTVTVSDAVDSVYDEYLKSQAQELGIKSYGACVDLLVEYFAEQIPALSRT